MTECNTQGIQPAGTGQAQLATQQMQMAPSTHGHEELVQPLQPAGGLATSLLAQNALPCRAPVMQPGKDPSSQARSRRAVQHTVESSHSPFLSTKGLAPRHKLLSSQGRAPSVGTSKRAAGPTLPPRVTPEQSSEVSKGEAERRCFAEGRHGLRQPRAERELEHATVAGPAQIESVYKNSLIL